MLPRNISKQNILRALAEIDRDGVPSKRESTKFFLKYNEQVYPPKYVISIANKYANGEELPWSNFGAGNESNTFLKNLGFDIMPKEFYSWEIVSSITIIKTLDKLAFLHSGTAVPRQLVSFFNVSQLEPGSSIEILLKRGKYSFKSRIDIGRERSPRAQLLWRADFTKILHDRFPDLHNSFENALIEHQYSAKLEFKKTHSKSVFHVKLMEAKPVVLKQGVILSNQKLCDLFRCSQQGGMRRSTKTNSLVLISDHTKLTYEDKWIDSTFHYTGMGLRGNQSLVFQQDKTLAQSSLNRVHLYFF